MLPSCFGRSPLLMRQIAARSARVEKLIVALHHRTGVPRREIASAISAYVAFSPFSTTDTLEALIDKINDGAVRFVHGRIVECVGFYKFRYLESTK